MVGKQNEEGRQAEASRRQSQKMEALGKLAGGIAHDFNNILTATLMQLTLLQQQPGFTDGMKENVREVEAETLRAVTLTRQLLMFSQRQEAKIELLDLNRLVGDLLKLLSRWLGENLKIEFRAAAEPAWVRADLGMMEQLVMNLCLNAREAMPTGGELTLLTALIEFDGQASQSNPEGRQGRFVCLTVMDSGSGREESGLNRIFEPFYATHEADEETGFGLPAVYGIVKQHAGWLTLESEKDHGRAFHVCLPAEAGPLRESSLAKRPTQIRGGTETILIVEDEHSVRRAAALWLRKLGYAALEAGDGVEAMQVWAEHHHKIDLLLSDMVMPETLTGLALAEKFVKEKPSLKVIISSGYGTDLKKSPLLGGQEVIYLPKPYPATALAMAVRRCLDGR